MGGAPGNLPLTAATFQAAQQENRQAMQGLQASIDRIANLLAETLGQLRVPGGNPPPPIAETRNRPDRRIIPAVHPRAVPEDGGSSEEEIDDVIFQHPRQGGDWVDREFKMRVDIPSFNDQLHIKDFLD